MKVSSNKIADLIAFYHEQLKSLYDTGELNAIVEHVFHHYLGFSRAELAAKQQEPVNQSDLLKIYDCCKALATGQPLQYVLGEAEFYGLVFKVNPSVLIPRPETEELVDIVLKDLGREQDQLHILDIGTGSGCIPVSIKKNRPGDDVYGLDVSAEALQTAAVNAALNDVSISWIRQDILQELKNDLLGMPYQVILSNPPYIQESEAFDMSTRVKDHEPHLALFVEAGDTIIFYKRIIDLCKDHLASGGKLYFELNPLTSQAVADYARHSGIFGKVETIKDMSGKIRFLKAQK